MQLPMLNDDRVDDYVEDVGAQLAAAIPAELRHAGFRYTFDVVNQKEINAFALPGGPMFLNRGMLEAAKSEAEVAGVMAHEISHVALRHGTAQATKGQKFQIGAVAGQILGAIIGGAAGSVISQGSQFGLGAYFLKYGREYERQADFLGAQIMARAGYDPREMANMFKTIQAEGGSSGPEWLSSHPDPGNRYNAIVKEASMLRIAGEREHGPVPVGQVAAWRDVARLHRRADRARAGTQGNSPAAAGRRSRVERRGGRHRRAAIHSIPDTLAGELPASQRTGQLAGSAVQRFADLRARQRVRRDRRGAIRVHARRADWRRRREAAATCNATPSNWCRRSPDRILSWPQPGERAAKHRRTQRHHNSAQQHLGRHRGAGVRRACRPRNCGTAACSTSLASRLSQRPAPTSRYSGRVRQSVQITDR